MPKIEKVFVFIATDKDVDDEGVVAVRMGEYFLPLVAADQARVDSLRSQAVQVARATGKRVHLVEFSQRRDLESY